MQVLTVTEARARLRELIQAANPTFIGSRRRAEAVLMSIDTYQQIVVPQRALRSLLALAAIGAGKVAVPLPSPDRHDDDFAHPGDSTGRVLAWLWSSGQHDRAMIWLADLLAEARSKCADDGIPPLRLEQILSGLPYAMPDDFPEHETAALVAKATTAVRGYYGSDPNAAQ